MQTRGLFVRVLLGVAAAASPLACALDPIVDVPAHGSDGSPTESGDGPPGGVDTDGGLGIGDDLSAPGAGPSAGGSSAGGSSAGGSSAGGGSAGGGPASGGLPGATGGTAFGGAAGATQAL